jgi:MSHA biogenesis protein MshJ
MKQLSKQLQQYWKRISDWVDMRKLSERLALFGAIAAVLIMAMHQLFLSAASVKVAALTKQMTSDKSTTRKLQMEIQKLAGQEVVDPDAENKVRLKKLVDEEAAAQAAIAALSKDLVAPDQMVAMLEAIMARQGKLQLLSLVKLPIQSLSTSSGKVDQGKKAAGQATAAQGPAFAASVPAADVVYKHGVEIVVQGSYLELMEYVAQLEKLPVRLVWGNLKLRVDDYPKTTLSLTMFTLSLEKKWLNI